MIGRRELFKRMAGAGLAAATVNPADLMAATQKASLMDGSALSDDPTTCVGVGGQTPNRTAWDIIDDIEWERNSDKTNEKYMSEEIRNKKSWSPAFKSILHSQQEREMRAIRKKIQNDADFAERVLALLGRR